MALRFPLVLNGSQIQELQPGDTLGGTSETTATATFANTAGVANAVAVNSTARIASVDTASTGTPNTIACRDGSGNLNAVLFQGTATAANFADLAEKYLPDQAYEVGTVVMVGGEAEVTACQRANRAFGAVSANPAFMMNATLEGGIYIALKGRVPIKVNGPIKKGDKLIADDNGCAGLATEIMKNMQIRISNLPDTFAIALETNLDPGIKLVECVIL